MADAGKPGKPMETEDGRNAGAAMTRDDWQYSYDERAGILEFDEVMPRKKAEALARQWLRAQGYNPALLVTERR